MSTSLLVTYYTDRVNLYDSELFVPLPAVPAPLPPPIILIHRTTNVGNPYPVPYYIPPYPTCRGCDANWNQQVFVPQPSSSGCGPSGYQIPPSGSAPSSYQSGSAPCGACSYKPY